MRLIALRLYAVLLALLYLGMQLALLAAVRRVPDWMWRRIRDKFREAEA